MGFLGQAKTSREEADHVRRSFSECGQFHRRKKRESRVSVGAADRRQVCGNNSCWDHDAVSCSPDFTLSPVNPSIFNEELGSSHVFELSMRAWITRRQEFWRTIARTGRSCGTQRPPRTIRTPRRRRRTTLSKRQHCWISSYCATIVGFCGRRIRPSEGKTIIRGSERRAILQGRGGRMSRPV